jgi:hypothetical protein
LEQLLGFGEAIVFVESLGIILKWFVVVESTFVKPIIHTLSPHSVDGCRAFI